MITNNNVLPTDRMIAGTTRKLTFYLYEDNKEPIDATGMVARFALSDMDVANQNPILTKNCTIEIVEGQPATISVILDRSDTINLEGKHIYQVTINNGGTVSVLKGILFLDSNFDKLDI